MSKSVELADLIRARAGDAPPVLGLILGSGLGHLAEEVDGVAIPYSDLPGFPHAGVSGHNPNLVIGNLEGVRVAVFGGRAHYYESGRGDAMRLPLEVLKALGGDTMIATNAAGSMVPDMATGSIMCLSDHINFSGLNPLIGEQTDARFVPMKDCYDPKLREAVLDAGAQPAPDLWPLYDALGGLPLALIRGANSDLLTEACADEMLRRRPDIIRADIADRGHVPFLDEEDALDALAEWLEDLHES